MGVHYSEVVPMDDETKKMISLEKVGLGPETLLANDFSNAMNHGIILALAVKRCVFSCVVLDIGTSFKGRSNSTTRPMKSMVRSSIKPSSEICLSCLHAPSRPGRKFRFF